MNISKIRIDEFGKLKDVEINFKKNINIILGCNESGKSTIIAFIKACLYGLSARGNDSDRKRYTPWSINDSFGGEMYFTHMGIPYRYICRFGKTKRSDTFSLYNNITGEQVKIPQNQLLGEYLFNLSEGAFDSSIYAPQLQSKIDTSKDKTGQILSKLAESSGSDTNSVNLAEKRLKSAMDEIKSPRGQNGILDKLYVVKRDTEQRLDELIKKEDEVKNVRKEYENLICEKSNIEQIITLHKAKESIKARNTIMEKMAHIDKLHEGINSYGTTNKKCHKSILFSFAILLVITSVFVYLSPVSPYFTLIPLSLTALLFLVGVKSNNFTHNISLSMKELEKEEAILDHILGNKSLSEYEEEWKLSEKILLQSNKILNTENIDDIKSRLERLNQDIAYKKAILETNTSNDNYVEIYKLHIKIGEDIKEYEKKYSAIKTAYETIKISFDELQTTFGPLVSDKIGEILKVLTDDEHDNVRLSKELDITLDERDGFHNATQYSGGTIDQIYLAFRLAVAKIISPDGVTLPIYLDEPFVQYDDNRLNRAIDYLITFSKENMCQIILTSCQDRIASSSSSLHDIYYIKL